MVWKTIKSGASKVVSVAKVTGSVAKSTGSAATSGVSGKLLTFLMVFVFANIGYLTGFPLIIYAWFAGFIGWIVNLFLGHPFIGLPLIPEFMFTYSKIITKYGWGFIFNGWYVWWFIRRRRAIKAGAGKIGFWNTGFGMIIRFAWLWVVFSFVFTVFYTGYNFDSDFEFPVTGCGIQRTAQSQLGLSPVSCEIEGFNLAAQRQSEKAEFAAATRTGMMGRLFAPFMEETGFGKVFKVKDVQDETILNEAAGSTLTDLRAPKLSYTANNRLAEDIKILANIEAKNLFLNAPSDSKILVKIEPSIPVTQCGCTGSSCLANEVNYPSEAFNPSGGQPIVFDNKEEVKCLINIQDFLQSGFGQEETEDSEQPCWCNYRWTCNIDGISSNDTVAHNTFMLGSGFHQQIKCIHPGLSLREDKFVDGDKVRYNGLGKPFYVDVDFSYDGIAAANKQLFVIDKNVARQEQDPINALNLGAYVISNSFNDGRVRLGIGTDTLYEFVTPAYYEDFSPDILDLGVSFSANRYPGGYRAEVNKVTLWVQVLDDSVGFVCGTRSLPEKNESTEKWEISEEYKCDPEGNSQSGNFRYEGVDETESYHKFVMNSEEAQELGAKTVLNLGEVANYEIKMFVPSEVLGGASYQGILIESEVEYTYTTRDDLLVRITHDEFVVDEPEDATVIGID
ncbi:MAG: hypothetical protein CXT77_04295 [uncultured DHVE6 group euryarchaeote]|jgi:hypothetical protein|nr:MAG: hypothetical protein CXT77_04295 [uncultured DHVE6 group euryarchaeote]